MAPVFVELQQRRSAAPATVPQAELPAVFGGGSSTGVQLVVPVQLAAREPQEGGGVVWTLLDACALPLLADDVRLELRLSEQVCGGGVGEGGAERRAGAACIVSA
jgi:hypothetical protein